MQGQAMCLRSEDRAFKRRVQVALQPYNRKSMESRFRLQVFLASFMSWKGLIILSQDPGPRFKVRSQGRDRLSACSMRILPTLEIAFTEFDCYRS